MEGCNMSTIYLLVGIPASGKSTYAKELKKEQKRTYVLHFMDKEGVEDYLKNHNKFECVYSNTDVPLAVISFPNDKHNEFFQTLAGVKITSFEEKPFTLQDYFMSFYKEERDFGGLSGMSAFHAS